MTKQKGVALFIAMLMLLMLTAIGSVLLSGSNLDLKMADAAAQRMASDQLLEGAIEDILTSTTTAAKFGADSSDITVASGAFDDVSATATPRGETACKRTLNPNQVKGFSCRYVDVRVSTEHGRSKSGGGKWAVNAMNAGVEQPIKTN